MLGWTSKYLDGKDRNRQNMVSEKARVTFNKKLEAEFEGNIKQIKFVP